MRNAPFGCGDVVYDMRTLKDERPAAYIVHGVRWAPETRSNWLVQVDGFGYVDAAYFKRVDMLSAEDRRRIVQERNKLLALIWRKEQQDTSSDFQRQWVSAVRAGQRIVQEEA